MQMIKLGDFKEQLGSVLGNIDSANKELEEVLLKLESSKKDFLKQQEYYTTQIAESNKKLESTKLLIESEMSRIASESDKLAKSKITFDKKVSAKEKEMLDIDKTIQVKNNELIRLQDSITELVIQKENLLKTTESLADVVTNSTTAINESIRILNDLNEKNQTIEKDNILKIALIQRLIDNKNKELNQLIEETQLESQKVANAYEALRLESEEFDKKYNDLTILHLRTKRAWETLYPGQNLDNIIKV